MTGTAGFSKLGCACVLLLMSVAVMTWGQQGATVAADQPAAVPQSAPFDPGLRNRPRPWPARSAEGRIHLDVMVTDAAGKPVGGLTAQDFTLLEDRKPKKIVSFMALDENAAKPEPPVEVILLIDEVNNGFVELGYIRQGVEAFLRQNGGHLAHPVSILLFTAKGFQTASQASMDGNALAKIVHQLNPSIRPRGMDLFELSILTLFHFVQDEARKPGRKLLIWTGPGWSTPPPNPIVLTQKDEKDKSAQFNAIVFLSTKLREARITLYGGYANSPYYYRDYLKGVKRVSDVDPRNLSLAVLALQSGGRGDLAAINRDSDLIEQLEDFVSEANASYTLTFNPLPTEHSDEYHDLKVVVSKPGLTARTNTGYYNQPDYSRPEPPPDSPHENRLAFSADAWTPKMLAKQVTVAQLQQQLKEMQGRPDADVARQLGGLELTERLSSNKLSALKAGLPGAKAQQALVALGDASVFLSPPDDEITASAAPDIAEQRRIIALTVNYLGKTIPKLPNFYANRATTRFDDTPPNIEQEGTILAGARPFHVEGSSNATVIYRNGKEEVNSAALKGKKPNGEEKGLITRGTFGPILSTVIVDASHSEMTWSRWEEGANGRVAVFRYAVPNEKSHYEVAHRSSKENDHSYDLDRETGYHGEVAIDPETGTIVRLTVEADINPGLAIERADIMVEYGPVEIGSKIYICPVRSVSLSTGRVVVVKKDRYGQATDLGAEFTRLNDVSFGEYHVFRSEARMLPGYDAGPD